MILEKLAKDHNNWLKMVYGFGCNKSIAEDIVQDMYIKVYELVERGKDISYGEDDVNRFYIYLTLKSIFGEYYRQKGKITVYSTDDDLTGDKYLNIASDKSTTGLREQEAFERAYDKVLKVLDTLPLSDNYPYFKNIFIGYNTRGLSMRRMAKETGINLNSIFNTLTKVMTIVRSEVGEDIEDYFNKDYHLI
jgi:DNA-directed RNA polymerase specialized sigma24 family protein|tara:strand:- start:1378 stop:1953 length:576 start_codon:yes stop_codon:yes gene_type:complete